MNSLLVYPMAAMVLLTFVILITMFRRRVSAVRAGSVDATYYKTYQGSVEPRETAALSRHFVNLFEAPVLFYVACVTAMVTGISGALIIILAWAYVALRVVHTIIHIGSNRIPYRIMAYFCSWLVLLAMWASIVAGVALR